MNLKFSSNLSQKSMKVIKKIPTNIREYRRTPVHQKAKSKKVLSTDKIKILDYYDDDEDERDLGMLLLPNISKNLLKPSEGTTSMHRRIKKYKVPMIPREAASTSKFPK